MKLTSQRKAALIAGISLLVMALAAIFSYGLVYQELVIPGDAKATFINLSQSTGLFMSGVVGWFLIVLLDLIVSLALYRFFAPVHKPGSLITAVMRVIYSFILAVAVFHLWRVNDLLASVTYYSEPANLGLMHQLNQFEQTWSYGLILFGCHLVGLGILIGKAKHIHKLWSILLLLAGVSYIFIHSGRLLPGFASTVHLIEPILVIPMTVGELGFAIWLLVNGGRKNSRTRKP